MNIFQTRSFWWGIAIGVTTPLLAISALSAIAFLLFDGPGAWSAGPQCFFGARKEEISPNGRFKATSIIVSCEDDEKNSSWHNNYVFVTSTRLSRTAQIYLLARKIALPAEVNWHTNRLIVLKVDETDREVASEPWCGIAATYQRRN